MEEAPFKEGDFVWLINNGEIPSELQDELTLYDEMKDEASGTHVIYMISHSTGGKKRDPFWSCLLDNASSFYYDARWFELVPEIGKNNTEEIDALFSEWM